MTKYNPLKPGGSIGLGTSGAEVSALQTQLNTQNAGKVGYKALVVDGKYGPLTQAAVAYKAPADVVPPPNINNPVTSGTDYRAEIDALGRQIAGMQASKVTAGEQALKDANQKTQDDLTKQRESLNQRKEAEIARIKEDFTIASTQQGERQARDYSGKSTNLTTAGGGFLGFTGSQAGVLENMQKGFDQEKTALISKKEAAIGAAQSAFTDKDFELASKMTKEAKDTEQELYNRQKEHSAELLQIARDKRAELSEERAQKNFERGYTDEKIKAYSAMSDEDFTKLTPDQLAETDRFLYTGATKDLRTAAISSAKNASYKSNLELRSTLQTLINKTPYGQKIPLPDGTFVVGQKRPPGSGSTANMITPLMASQVPALKGFVGQDEKAMIKTLIFENPPQWYVDYYKQSSPDAFAGATKESIKSDWTLFKAQPDISAWRNTVDLTKENSSSQDIINAINNLKEDF